MKLFKPLIPKAALDFYCEFRLQRPLVDRSEVVLYASPDILPAYSPRQPLSPSCPPLGEMGSDKSITVSLIATVKNEAAHAREWLASLLQQTHPPDEVVITDGGSTDGTVTLLQEVARTFPVPIKVIETPGAKVAQGRNIAIRKASHPIIACTDFGCVLDPDWLRFLILPFENDTAIEASGGYYQAIVYTTLDRLCRRYFFVDFNTILPQSFMPSSRSFAFKKSLWEKAGGYPEYLTISGEDTLFDYNARQQPSRWAFVPDARVAWRPPHTYAKLCDTYFRYARGDGETGILAPNYWYQVVEAGLNMLRRAFLLLVVILGFLFLKGWGWLIVAALLAYSSYRFVSINQRLSAEIGVRFYPVTVLDEIVGLIQAIGYTAGVRNRPRVRQRQIALYRQQLQDILVHHPDRQGIIVYPPTHDWGFMFQRPHQLARTFARQGYLYFYCTSNEKTDGVVGFRPVEPSLYLYHGPLEAFGELPRPLVYLGSPWNRAFLPCFDRPQVIYDQYDDLEVSGGRMEDYDYLLKTADVMVVSSKPLLETALSKRPDVVLAPNGVDVDYIQQHRPSVEEIPPSDLQPILARGRPIIGYSGGLAVWFDYDLLTYLSKACQEVDFVLVGVNYDGSLDRSGVLNLGNVHWLGMKAYHELFSYVWRFDVGIIPFKINSITLATSPIKLFEYMACRKPVVSTALPECRDYPGVFVAETYEQFAACLVEALRVRQDASYLNTLDEVARQNTWESRANAILATLD